MDEPGPPEEHIQLHDFPWALDKFAFANGTLTKAIEKSNVFIKIKPRPHLSFLTRCKLCNDYINDEIDRFWKNEEVSNSNLLNETIEFNYTIIVIWERVLLRIRKRIHDVPRFADVSTHVGSVLNTIKNLHDIVESAEVQGMRFLRYPAIELDEIKLNAENQERGAYHERERIHDQSSQTFKLLEYVKDLEKRERLYAMNEIMKEKFIDERLYYDLCLPYGELVKRYETIHKMKMRPTEMLTRIGPRTPSPVAARNESIERSGTSSESGQENEPIEVDPGEEESEIDDVMEVGDDQNPPSESRDSPPSEDVREPEDVGREQRGETPEDVREPEAMPSRESSPEDVSEPEGAREVSPEDAKEEFNQEEPMSPGDAPEDAPEDAGIPEVVISREESEEPESSEGYLDEADVESILDPTSPYNQRQDLPPESPVFAPRYERRDAPEIPHERPTYAANNGSPNSSHYSEASEDRRRRNDTPEEDILMEPFDEENAQIEDQNESDSEDSDEDVEDQRLHVVREAPELVGIVPRNSEDREPPNAPYASSESAPEGDEDQEDVVNQRERSSSPPPDTFDETLAVESPEGRRLSVGSGCSEDSRGDSKTPEVKKEPEDQMPSPDIFESSFVNYSDVPGSSDRVVEAPESRRPKVEVKGEEETSNDSDDGVDEDPESSISDDNAVVETPESWRLLGRPPSESSEKPDAVPEASEDMRSPSPESSISDDNAVVETPESKRLLGRPPSESSEKPDAAPGASEDMRSPSSRSYSPDDNVVMEDSDSRTHLTDSEDEDAMRTPSPGSIDDVVMEAPESRRLLGRQQDEEDSAESESDEEESTEGSSDSDDDNTVVEAPESRRLLGRPPSESSEEAVIHPEGSEAGSSVSDDNDVAEAPESRRLLGSQQGEEDDAESDNDEAPESGEHLEDPEDNTQPPGSPGPPQSPPQQHEEEEREAAPIPDMELLREFFNNIPIGGDDDLGTPSSYHSSEISSNPTTPERHEAPPAIEVDGAVYRQPEGDVADSEGTERRDGGADDAGTSSGVHGLSDNEEQENHLPNEKKRTKRGIRYDEEFKVSVVKYARETDIVKATKKFGVSKPSVLRWMEQIKLPEEAPERNVGAMRLFLFAVEMELWIKEQKEKNLRPTREEVLEKAEEVDSSMRENTDWVDSLLKEHDLLPRKEPKPEFVSIPKMIEHILCLETIRIENRYRAILACDEVYLEFDWSRPESDKAKQVSMTLTGHEILNVTVMLCARSDGSKCRPYVLLPVRKPEQNGSSTRDFEKFMKLIWAGNTEFDEILTQHFLRKIVGNSVSTGQLLIWDDAETHVSDGTKETSSRLNIDTVVIPEGMETFLQPSTCYWEAPFKAKIQEFYEEWMIHGQKAFTRTRKMKPPAMNLYLKWILDAWRELPKELIIRSFKECGLSTIPGGVEDDLLHCFRELPQGLEMLKKARAPPEESEEEGVAKQEDSHD